MDFQLAIALDGVPFPTPSDGTDITADVWAEQPITIDMGRDGIRQFLPMKVGALTVKLNNLSRKYSPNNTLSPYYDSFQPPRDMRLSTAAGSGGSLDLEGGGSLDLEGGGSLDLETTAGVPIFTGRLDNVGQNIEWGNRTVNLSILSMASRLVGKKIDTQLYQDVTIDQAIGYVLDAAGEPAADRILDVSSTILPWFWADGDDAFALFTKLVDTEGAAAYPYEDGYGNIVFKNKTARLTESRSTMSQATYSATSNIFGFTYEPNYKNVVVGVKVTQVVRKAQALDVLWSYGQRLVLTANQVRVFQVRGSDPFLGALIPSPAGRNEEQVLTASVLLTSGTFIANVNGTDTSAIAFGADAATIQAAFEAAAGSGNIQCGGMLSTGLRVQFCGALKEKAIPLITITSSLNTGVAPASINAIDITDGPDTTWRLYASAVLSAGSFRIKNYLGNKTAALGYNATALQIQNAIELEPVIAPGDVPATGGPISTTEVIVPFSGTMTGISVPLSITDASTLKTATAATATVLVTETVKGGGPDYVASAGDVTFTLDRDNGPFAKLTATASAAGATIDGLQVRARQVSVIRTQEVSHPADLSGLTEGQIMTPDIREEIQLADAENLVLDLHRRYDHSRPSIPIQIMMALNDANVANELSRQIGDRVTVIEDQTGVNYPCFIEQKAYAIDAVNNMFSATYGCEKA